MELYAKSVAVNYLPVIARLEQRPSLVVEGGEVEVRSTRSMISAGAAVSVNTLVLRPKRSKLPVSGQVQRGLARHGRAAATPAAVIENGARPDQIVFVTTLGNLAETVLERNVRAPSILLVCEVAACASRDR